MGSSKSDLQPREKFYSLIVQFVNESSMFWFLTKWSESKTKVSYHTSFTFYILFPTDALLFWRARRLKDAQTWRYKSGFIGNLIFTTERHTMGTGFFSGRVTFINVVLGRTVILQQSPLIMEHFSDIMSIDPLLTNLARRRIYIIHIIL